MLCLYPKTEIRSLAKAIGNASFPIWRLNLYYHAIIQSEKVNRELIMEQMILLCRVGGKIV